MKFKTPRNCKFAALFGVLCVGTLVAVAVADSAILKVLVVNAALAFAGVASGYAGLGPRVFGKRGAALPFWSWLVFWPYFALNFLSLWLFRRASRENPFDEIAPRLWLGCRLWPGDETHLPGNVKAVLDLTAEFPETGFLRRKNYRCIPILDTTAPTLDELREGVQFMDEGLEVGAVYVHCALGHGRSGTFVAATLLASGQVKSVKEALALLRAVRPGVDLHAAQRALLEEFRQTLP
jgi:hypothetical protein